MKIDREKLKAKAEIDILLHENDFPPEDSFDDPRDVAWAKEQIEAGNEWGWCCVQVRARFADWTGSDFLGGCSYENERAFKVPGGYYEDMVNNAIEELAQQMERALSALEVVKTDPLVEAANNALALEDE